MDLGISGRNAVVTGGDSGMGLATARLLAAEGVRILLTDKEPDALAKAASTVAGEVRTVAADLTRAGDVARLAAEAGRQGPVHILVHAAGITGATGDFLDLTDDDWRQAIDVDLMNGVRVCRAFIPGMRAVGWGRVVLFASEDAMQPYVEELPYCAAKAGVLNLAKGLAKAYGPDGLTVNTVSPAFVATPMTDAMMDKRAKENGTSFDEAVTSFLREERPGIALQRRGRAEEVAAAVAFLCSAAASFINGANVRVDGGSVMTMST
jgi:3-oxoacyl-[acyl-carrier protein] reductase